MYRFKAVLIKIPINFFFIETNNTKIVETTKDPQIAKAILRKKDKAGNITVPNCKLYYKAIVIKTACY